MSLASLIPIPVSAIKLFDRIDLVSLQNKPPDLVTGPQFAGLADGRLDGPSDHTFQRCDAMLQFRDASSQVAVGISDAGHTRQSDLIAETACDFRPQTKLQP
jgi:hypothetical protein